MTYSKLTNEVVLADTSNYTHSRQGYKICKITPHHMVAVWTGKRCAQSFQDADRNASANYCIGNDGDIVCNVPEEFRAWTSGNGVNDCQAITIEVSNCELKEPYKISEKAWNSLVNLCVDICTRYKFKLEFDGTPSGSLTMHKMFQNTSCPGTYLSSKMEDLANEVNTRLGGTPKPTPQPTPTTKYGVGTVVCTNTLATSSAGGMVYKGDWKGTITRVVEGTSYPYLLNDGTGWTNDAGIDSDPHVANSSATPSNPVDQILEKGSRVTSVAMSITGVKMVDGVECANIPALGGWFPTKYVSEYDASDGAKDNYLATTKAKVYVDTCTVEQVDIKNNLVMIHGIWVKPAPLTEI